MGPISPKELAEKLNIHEVVAEIMIDRGIDTDKKVDKFLNGNLKDLYHPSAIPKIKEVTDTIKEFAYFSSIVIYSDYDADGVSSAYIMYSAIKKLAQNANVEVFLSNRFRDGYGLSKHAVDIIAEDGAGLIITLDCGISNNKEIEYAKSKGLEVVVIDHHENDENPPDVPFVDLKVKSELYPFTELCGAGATWKVCQYLLDDDFLEVLDVVAIATVADVVPLIDENRIIVKEGIELIKQRKCNAGVQALLDVNEIENSKFTSMDIGFNIGPLINATGRLGSAYPALQILLEQSPREIDNLAHELFQTNKQRRNITKQIFAELERNIDKNDNVIVCESKIHQGIVGLIAGRISNRYNKPAIVVDKMSRKGSARSIEPFNLYQNLKQCLNEGLLESAGGHSMAAGLSVPRQNFRPFKIRINQLANDIEFKTFDYDKEIKISDINDKLIYDLNILEPCGQENSKPLFLTKNLNPESIWVLPGGEHIKFKVDGVEAIAFRMAFYESQLRAGGVDLIYTVGFNEWNGSNNIQLIVRNINPFD